MSLEVIEVKMEQQHELGWCSQCKKVRMFVTHADFPKRWHCTSRGCYYWTTELKNKPKVKE